MTYDTKTGKENTKEMDYNNSSGRFGLNRRDELYNIVIAT